MYLLGYDIGSSSIKATLLNAETGGVVASATSPANEMEIIAARPGWAEQYPETWWDNVIAATHMILSKLQINVNNIKSIGIAYQMHGLVIVDKNKRVLRPSIIWCDSRAVELGDSAFREIGPEHCLARYLNSPGNFTASKLKWVKENEKDIFANIYKAMLPGDYIAMKMTGEIKTTPSGLSEGIMWDFRDQNIAHELLDYYGIPEHMIADLVPTFSVQGKMTETAAAELGLRKGIEISYRSGDQPNNALSLNVLNPGEIAATAGTSGVVYGVSDEANYDPESRVNSFVHVTHTTKSPRYGVLLCVNGTGILNSWMKNYFSRGQLTYEQMNELAKQSPAGSEGLTVIPFGNGAERTLANKDIGASIHGLQLTRHNGNHLLRAAQEGIVFALKYGLEIMHDMGVEVSTVRAGDSNMFLSPIFREAFATTTNTVVELYNTDGSQGAARGAGIGSGVYARPEDAFNGLSSTMTIEPNDRDASAYQDAYDRWKNITTHELGNM